MFDEILTPAPVPSIAVPAGSATIGSGDSTRIVPGAPGRKTAGSKVMTSRPGSATADSIARRNVHEPGAPQSATFASDVSSTTKVLASAAGVHRAAARAADAASKPFFEIIGCMAGFLP
jgi:hypothetical protein